MQRLIDFLQEHHVMCLATTGAEGPRATPVFYALCEEPFKMIFLSDPKTRHMQELALDPRLSAGVYWETKKVGLIQGAQLWGKAEIPQNSKTVAALYFKKFPYARLFHLTNPSHVFCEFFVQRARWIDNRLGFGKKLEWEF